MVMARVMESATIVSAPIDETVYNMDVYSLPLEQFSALQRGLISQYLSATERNCPAYGAYVNRGRLRSGSSAEPFRYIPTSMFKVTDLLSAPAAEVEKWCVSSGTRGRQSRIGRDRTTLERLLGSVRQGLSLIEEWDEESLDVIHLGPSYEDAGDIWFPYVMSLAELLYATESFGRGSKLDISGAISRYVKLRATGRQVGVIGPPFAVRAFCEAYRSAGHPQTAGGEVAVVTGGGWKTHEGSSIPRDRFRALVASSLGLDDDSRVRDAFNQVELNTVLLECERHRFHIPPWLEVTAIRPESLEPLHPGEIGLLAYVDASASSYPCVFIGDDMGNVSEGPCSCGRPGSLLQFERRLDRGGDAGCAIALAARFSEGLAHA
ncbi:MAG: long-chain fatty acid--CoA ligase [Acidobacteria bacterium]|nr:MAG: long-chain fatty acid--CoA ligase [Acidobacteriota bacterium]